MDLNSVSQHPIQWWDGPLKTHLCISWKIPLCDIGDSLMVLIPLSTKYDGLGIKRANEVWAVPLAVIILTYTIFTSLCHDFEPARLNSLFLSRWLLPPMTQQWFYWTKRWVSQLATFGVSWYWTKNKDKERICCSGLRDGPWLSSSNRVTGTYQGQEGVFITQRIPLGVS